MRRVSEKVCADAVTPALSQVKRADPDRPRLQPTKLTIAEAEDKDLVKTLQVVSKVLPKYRRRAKPEADPAFSKHNE